MNVLRALSDALTALVDRVGPAVVHVRAIFDRRPGTATGSGVVVTADGHALTNSHVVHGATALEVAFPDGRTPRSPRASGGCG
jgi:putative serine protease PepD